MERVQRQREKPGVIDEVGVDDALDRQPVLGGVVEVFGDVAAWVHAGADPEQRYWPTSTAYRARLRCASAAATSASTL